MNNLVVEIIIFILGLTFGSFINVLIYRLPKGISIMGRSFCPKCKHGISWTCNIPLLSYLLLGGKCKNCNKKISLLYPVIEASTGLLFVVTYLYSSSVEELIVRLVILCILIPIFVIDIKYQIIPDELIYSGLLIVFCYLIFINPVNFYQHLFSGFLVSLSLLFLHLITRGRGMGLGDVKFALFAGTFLGLPYSIIFIYLSFIAGALVGTVLILVRLSKFGKHIAFGPFLAVSFWIMVLWGDQIWKIVSRALL